VKVALIDSGLVRNHPDLPPTTKIVDQVICHSQTGCAPDTTYDGTNHGTKVAGIATGLGVGDYDMRGIAYGAPLLFARFNTTQFTATTVGLALDWSLFNGAKVINMSFGIGLFGCDDSISNVMVDEAVDEGAVVVKSVGNEGAAGPTNPGCGWNVISVGAINDNNSPDAWDDTLYDFTSLGPFNHRMKPEISAPGVDVNSTYHSGGYAIDTYGTSFAAPFVTGAAALILQAHPEFNPLQAKASLLLGANWNKSGDYTSADFENEGSDDSILNSKGFGMLNVGQSLNYANSDNNIIMASVTQSTTKQYTFSANSNEQVKIILSWLKHPTGTALDPTNVTISNLNFVIKNSTGIVIQNSSSQYQNNEFAVFSAPYTGLYIITVSAAVVDPMGGQETFVLGATHPLSSGSGGSSSPRTFSAVIGGELGTAVRKNGVVETNAATGTTCPSSSYLITGGTTGRIKVPTSGSNSKCERMFIEFNTASIPSAASITQVSLKLVVTAIQDARNCDFTPISSSPSVLSASALWADIGDGTAYVANSSVCTSTGSKTVTLGTPAAVELKNKLTNNWFAVGIKHGDETRPSSNAPATTIALTTNGDEAKRPLLVVNYTLPSDSQVYGTAYANLEYNSTIDSPRYREWNPSELAWSSEVFLPDTDSRIRSTWIAYSPITTNTVMIMTLSDDGTLNLFRCNGSCTTASNWDLAASDFADVGSPQTSSPIKYAEMAFEQSSGDLVIVYDKTGSEANDFYYRQYTPYTNSLSSESGYNYKGGASADSELIYFFEQKSKPGSNDITMGLLADTIEAFVWNGTGFGNQKTISTTLSGNGQSMGVAYETASGTSIIVGESLGGNVSHARWNGSMWSSVSKTDFNSANGYPADYVRVVADPSSSSNKLMICVLNENDDTNEITCAEMNTGSLGSWTTIATSSSSSERTFDYLYDSTGGKGIIIFQSPVGALNESGKLYWRSWDGSQFAAKDLIRFTEYGSDHWILGGASRYASDSYHGMFLIQYKTDPVIGSIWHDSDGIGSFGDSSHSSETQSQSIESQSIAAKP
jgi:hypothetical protein